MYMTALIWWSIAEDERVDVTNTKSPGKHLATSAIFGRRWLFLLVRHVILTAVGIDALNKLTGPWVHLQ